MSSVREFFCACVFVVCVVKIRFHACNQLQDKAAEEKYKENRIYKRQLIGLLAKVKTCTNRSTHGILWTSSLAVLFNSDGRCHTGGSWSNGEGKLIWWIPFCFPFLCVLFPFFVWHVVHTYNKKYTFLQILSLPGDMLVEIYRHLDPW